MITAFSILFSCRKEENDITRLLWWVYSDLNSLSDYWNRSKSGRVKGKLFRSKTDDICRLEF